MNDDVALFVSAYSAADEHRIRFAWNGKHAEEFRDSNMDFRKAVRRVVLSDIDAAPIELVRDLFKAETECSREAWGINRGVDVMAERLLRSDPERFVEDYLTGKFQSFDAHLGSAFPTDSEIAARLLEIVQRRLSENPSDDRRELLVKGRELFEGWLNSN